MKYFKCISSLILVIIIFTSSTLNIIAQNDTVNNMFTIEEKIINEESEFFKQNIKYPYLKVKEDYKDEKTKNIVNNINKEIEEYINNFIQDIKSQSDEYLKEYNEDLSKSKDDYIKYQYEAYSDYKITYNKNNILSIPITTYNFTGGAHGMSYLKSFNYDLITGEILSLKDMFKDNIDYKKIVNDYINSEIEKNKDNYFSGKDGFNGISDNQEFYIDNNGIVVYFQLYDIAPYYVGIPKFDLTNKEFKKYLK